MFDDEDANDQILLGQMCYDELEPIPEKEEEIIMKHIDGQMGFDEMLKSPISSESETKKEQQGASGQAIKKNLDNNIKKDN